MALSGIQIYKLLPQTNCKDCGFPTCLAFAMKLAAKQLSDQIENWQPGDPIPYLSPAVFPKGKKIKDYSKLDMSPSRIMFEYLREDWHGYS